MEQIQRPPRALLIDSNAAASAHAAAELRARGMQVATCTDAPGAVRILNRDGADVVVLATPLGDADWIATAAALKGGAAPPALVLLDGTGQASELGRLLPANRMPDAILPRSAGIAELLYWIADALGETGSPAPCIAEILVALRARGDSGVLEVRGGGICTRILLRDGVPVFAEGGALRETLGRMLLRHGALTEAEYVQVIERMTERLIENEATRMGEVLVELGLLTPHDVVDALAIQVREKILRCFQWTQFEHHFELLDGPPDAGLVYSCPPIEALILAGLREHFDAARIEPLLSASAGLRVRLSRGAEETALRFQAKPAEQRLLRDIKGDRTVAELCNDEAVDAEHARPLLAALIVTQALHLAAPAATPRVAKPEPARVRREAPERPRAAATPTTTPLPMRSRAASARSLSSLRRELAKSGKAPAAATPTPPADQRSARIDAERAFRQGIQMLEQAALGGAQKAFALACERWGDEPEYRMLDAWVQVLILKDETARSAARVETTAWARKVLERDRDSVRAQTILGQLAIAAGDLAGAERHFRHALRVAPEDRDALRGARQVERRRSEQPAQPTTATTAKSEKATKR